MGADTIIRSTLVSRIVLLVDIGNGGGIKNWKHHLFSSKNNAYPKERRTHTST